jgi:rhamnosyltransferase
MVEELLKALDSRPDAACVGPRYLDDRRKSLSPFIRTQGLGRIHCACTYPNEIIETDQLIASGALVPMNAFERIGVMREDFFIGYVDTEWGLRAKANGHKSYGVCSAHMQHRLGEDPISFFGKTFPSNSPLRNLYHSRNTLLLYREPWLPLKWKIIDGYHLLIKFVFYSLFAKQRFEHFKMMSLGLFDGIRGKGGKFQGFPH